MKKALTRIAFCGSACSGKTSVLNMLKERLNPAVKEEWNVTFVQEAATHILLTTDLHPKKDPVGFQRAVSLYQFIHEEYDRCFDDTKLHNVSLSDRGIADAFIYVPDDAETLLDQTIEQAVNRYAVLYFLPYYPDNILDGNEQRYESKDDLCILEQKTFDVWSKSPNMFVIPLFPTIVQKVDFVIKCLNQILGAEVFI